MKIEINLENCLNNNISPNQYILLHLMLYKEWGVIKEMFGKEEAEKLRDELLNSKYILNNETVPFTSTILSTNHVSKLLGIKADNIRFIEFYNLYPVRVGSRVLRAANIDTVLGKKHEKKYLSKVKTAAQHEIAMKATKAYVEKQRVVGKLQFLPAMERVLNNALWETWLDLIPESGQEGANWNADSI